MDNLSFATSCETNCNLKDLFYTEKNLDAVEIRRNNKKEGALFLKHQSLQMQDDTGQG